MERRVVVVTGGTSGIGRAIARRFAQSGAAVAVLARGRDGLAATQAELRRLGTQALALEVDVAQAQQVFEAAVRIERELGPLDVWVNCAMSTVFGPSDEISEDEFRRVTDVCYHGYVFGTQAALVHMRHRGRGVIVQVGSAMAYRGIPLQAAYCGAKHAIRGFTDSVRCELLHQGSDVKLTMVQLPAVNTPQFRHCLNKMGHKPRPMGLVYQPEVCADAVYYASLHPRREIYVGHTTVEAVIGQKLAPGMLDRFLAKTAWDGQITDEPADPERPCNLFSPVPGDPGAHGAFDREARSHDPVTQLTQRLGAGGVRFLIALIAPVWGMVVMARRLVALWKETNGHVLRTRH
jgi:NAD(P)-dependent dehydrogenase (short-subunit alcohol dehydrogenase family)